MQQGWMLQEYDSTSDNQVDGAEGLYRPARANAIENLMHLSTHTLRRRLVNVARLR